MNDIYGMDPCTPNNLKDLSDLIKIFGPSEGRFIADFPMGWSGEVHDHMRKVSDLSQFAMVEAWLRIGRHAVLPVKAKFKNSLPWQENAIALKAEVVKLIGPAGRPANIVQPIDYLLIDPDAFPDSRGDHLPRTSTAYVKAVRPILLGSPKIVLVDPYFSLRFKDKNTGVWRDDRRCKFIELLLKEAVIARKVECFEIFTDTTKSVDTNTSLEHLRRIADAAGAHSMHLQVCELDKRLSTDRHARYFLGMASGLHFDHGFDISDDGSTNHVEWIGKTALTPLLNRFT